MYVPGKTVVIQYGAMRTATTLQTQIVRTLASLQCVQAGMPPPEYFYVEDVQDVPASGFVPGAVYKTHSLGVIEALNASRIDALRFTTSRDGAPPRDADRYAYVQNYAYATRCASGIVVDYLQFFNLTTFNAELAAKKLKMWDVARLCCGKQSSLQNRLRLHGCPPLRMWFDEHTPDCEMYDLDAVSRFASFATVKRARDAPYQSPFDQAGAASESVCKRENGRVRAGAVSHPSVDRLTLTSSSTGHVSRRLLRVMPRSREALCRTRVRGLRLPKSPSRPFFHRGLSQLVPVGVLSRPRPRGLSGAFVVYMGVAFSFDLLEGPAHARTCVHL